MMEVLDIYFAVRDRDTGLWYEWHRPWEPGVINWTSDFSKAYRQSGGHKEELFGIADDLRQKGFNTETVKLSLVEICT